MNYMNDDSDDDFQTPENSLYEGGAVKEYNNTSHINDIQYIYFEFKQLLEHNKKHHYNEIIINKIYNPSNLQPLSSYLNKLNEDRMEFINMIQHNKTVPQFAIEFYNKYKDSIINNDILQMLLIDAIEVSYHCYPYSQNNETLTND